MASSSIKKFFLFSSLLGCGSTSHEGPIPDASADHHEEAGMDAGHVKDGGHDADASAPRDAARDTGPSFPGPHFQSVVGSCKKLWLTPGATAASAIGQSLVAVDDVDHDGARDVVASSVSGSDSVLELLSGKSGKAIRPIPITGTVERVVLVDDVDGDGLRDVAVTSVTGGTGTKTSDAGVSSTSDAGAVTTAIAIVSTANGKTLASTSSGAEGFASGVAALDTATITHGLLVGSLSSGPGAVTFYDAHLTPAGQLATPAAASPFYGGRVLEGPDVNGDGTRDFFVGDSIGATTNLGGGRLYLLSGSDGSEIWHFDGNGGENDLIPDPVLLQTPDLDGDGVADVLVSSITHAPSGKVWALSGKTGAALWTVTGDPKRWAEDFGTAAANLADLDGDGVVDLLVGAPVVPNPTLAAPPDGSFGRFVVLSGKDGSVLVDLLSVNVDATTEAGATLPSDDLGVGVDSPGDLDGDGHADVVVSAPNGFGGSGFVAAFHCESK